MTTVNLDGARATAVSKNGVRVVEFDDGSCMVALDDGALHFREAQAEELRAFVRMFDQHRESPTLLTEARDIIYGDREQTHGEPSKNLHAIAQIWTAILGTPVSEQLVCLMMIGLKLARAANAPRHREHWLDTVGYAALAERCGLVAPPKSAQAAQAELRG